MNDKCPKCGAAYVSARFGCIHYDCGAWQGQMGFNDSPQCRLNQIVAYVQNCEAHGAQINGGHVLKLSGKTE